MSEWFTNGSRLEDGGDIDAALAAYRSGEAEGFTDCSNALGRLLAGRRDIDGAEAAFRRAWDGGSVNGAYNLGILLEFDGHVATSGVTGAWRSGR